MNLLTVASGHGPPSKREAVTWANAKNVRGVTPSRDPLTPLTDFAKPQVRASRPPLTPLTHLSASTPLPRSGGVRSREGSPPLVLRSSSTDCTHRWVRILDNLKCTRCGWVKAA